MSSFLFVLVGPAGRSGTRFARLGAPATDDVERAATASPPEPASRPVAHDTPHEFHHEIHRDIHHERSTP